MELKFSTFTDSRSKITHKKGEDNDIVWNNKIK